MKRLPTSPDDAPPLHSGAVSSLDTPPNADKPRPSANRRFRADYADPLDNVDGDDRREEQGSNATPANDLIRGNLGPSSLDQSNRSITDDPSQPLAGVKSTSKGSAGSKRMKSNDHEVFIIITNMSQC